MNIKVIKVIGMVASIAGAALSLVSSWSSDKLLDHKIGEKVEELLDKN